MNEKGCNSRMSVADIDKESSSRLALAFLLPGCLNLAIFIFSFHHIFLIAEFAAS